MDVWPIEAEGKTPSPRRQMNGRKSTRCQPPHSNPTLLAHGWASRNCRPGSSRVCGHGIGWPRRPPRMRCRATTWFQAARGSSGAPGGIPQGESHVTLPREIACFWFVYSDGIERMMKRIVLLVCGMVFLVSNSAQAQRTTTRTSGGTYPQQSVRVAPASYNTRPAQPVRVANYPTTQQVRVAPASNSARPAAQPVRTATSAISTRTAQGVANIMASTGRVGHWGGNPGYEGCGAGGSPAAAYNNCCYSRSGMSTVDVGYARGNNGMWFCCRRYR